MSRRGWCGARTPAAMFVRAPGPSARAGRSHQPTCPSNGSQKSALGLRKISGSRAHSNQGAAPANAAPASPGGRSHQHLVIQNGAQRSEGSAVALQCRRAANQPTGNEISPCCLDHGLLSSSGSNVCKQVLCFLTLAARVQPHAFWNQMYAVTRRG